MTEDRKNEVTTREPSVTTSSTDIADHERHWPFLVLAVLFGFAGGIVSTYVVANETNPRTIIESGQNVILQEGQVIADIAERVGPSVVSIAVEGDTQSSFFGARPSQSVGTGIILSEDGLVVTNKHVIPQSFSSLMITTADGQEFTDVELVDRDPFNDIAYLQINGVADLNPAELGDSSEVRVGERVIAIGNTLGRFSNTVTSGIISGEGRPILAGGQGNAAVESLTNLFQTDAAINPGNSGGPLVDINGAVIGINTAVAGNAENVGFAIPINDVKPGISSVRENGELRLPYLGVRYTLLNEDIADRLNLEQTTGALVFSESSNAVLPGSPAEKAGLKNGDVITEIDGKVINQDSQLANVIGKKEVGSTIKLTIIRDGEELELEATLEAIPDNF